MCGGKRAAIRANRKASSAPSPREQNVYARELRRVLRGVQSPRVLVLGATPELRDIAIKQGAQTLAVDWSWDTLASLTQIMKYQDDERNLLMRSNWIVMNRGLEPRYFHAILGDASLLNTPFDGRKRILSVCNTLLRTGEN